MTKYPNLRDVPAKLAYEWVRTCRWNKQQFVAWLNAKQLDHGSIRTLPGGTVVYRTSAELAYEWVRTKHWNRWLFQNWLNHML